MPLREVLRRRDLLIFLVSVVLFHFGNAAMLPTAGQVLAQTHPGSDTIALSACIIAAQLVMVGVAWAVGQATARAIGRKAIFLIALPVRGVLFSLTASPYAVVAIQLLDGGAAGIFVVISVLIAADLMPGTGRFNLAQGLVALAPARAQRSATSPPATSCSGSATRRAFLPGRGGRVRLGLFRPRDARDSIL